MCAEYAAGGNPPSPREHPLHDNFPAVEDPGVILLPLGHSNAGGGAELMAADARAISSLPDDQLHAPADNTHRGGAVLGRGPGVGLPELRRPSP